MKNLTIELPIKITPSVKEDGYIIEDANKTEYYFYKKEGVEPLEYDGFCKSLDRIIEKSDSKSISFEVGKAYQHSSGMQYYICGEVTTHLHGKCFMAEQGWEMNLRKKREEDMQNEYKENGGLLPSGGLVSHAYTPVGVTPEHAENWVEIPVESFVKNNFC